MSNEGRGKAGELN